jgi:hypothetical protein
MKRDISSKVLLEARDRFHTLLDNPRTLEVEWQNLFTECPCILSESLPLRIHPDDIHPLGRPGRSEADFLFYPHEPTALSPYGVIEIKRPNTRILRVPRRDTLVLSADAATAMAQARVYAMNLERQYSARADRLVVIGNELHVFLIVGMSDDIARKATTDLLRAQLAGLFPQNFRLIPFDTLLSLFEDNIKPHVHILNTSLPQATATLIAIIENIEQTYNKYQGFWLDDSKIDLWTLLEAEFLAAAGPYSYGTPVVERRGFEIIGSNPDSTGRQPIATEAPNPSMFAMQVCTFVSRAISTGRAYGVVSHLPLTVSELWSLSEAYASD